MSSSFHWVYRPMWFILGGGVEVFDCAFGMVVVVKEAAYLSFKLRMTMNMLRSRIM